MAEKIDYGLIFAENQQLETARLILRPLTLADADEMFAFAGDVEVARYVSYEPHADVNTTRSVIANYFMKESFGKFAITLKASGKMVGTIDLRVDENNQVAEIGYALHRNYWRQGITTEAAKVLIDFGFGKLNLLRIFAVYNEKNPNSGGVMKKLGMLQEGRIVDAKILKGEKITLIQWGITQAMWQINQKNEV
ncbi:ribosomal-protein-alanine N-acetyltransferase [Enterococcus sp. PF1-24]|uniref:GNAT family N-acetyltransferase n=1 Tax=unclassified Enterococcus TaxID=2608891 RepID=UPI0024749525|nr:MULTISPECIES: GNAT family N-acetyltransferase [unclassified Enterococcus]MDH6363817.1 ribosomal-protein-alanine N-acetyltransferase [Enterococcus sp. PFB1-1]MDH6400997.1 ribosomal-protein-alanine N-acetyltransferase [Enterococcus sp. PF1-24]